MVDLGTGTGSVVRGLAGMGCNVTGIDPSLELLRQAGGIVVEENLNVKWLRGTAEATGLKEGRVDIVAVGQCWHGFDPEAAIAEVRRILKADGLLLIPHFDWLPLMGNVVWHTEKPIKKVNTAWNMDGGCGVYP